MPVEGTWFVNPYRTPLIAFVNPKGQLERNLEETQHRISFRKGGEKVPAGENYLQYVGVSNQYFVSMVVLDDQQAPRVAGGVNKESILSYAQPTLESEEIKGRVKEVDADNEVLRITVFDPNF